MFQTIFLIFIVVNFSIFVKTQTITLQGHNEHCELYDETSGCDHTIGLMCIDSGLKGYRCKCPNDAQFGTIYDPKRNKCVGKVLNSCVRLNSHITPSIIKFNLNDTLCVENAECNNKLYHLPICLCSKGFFEEDEGTCRKTTNFGEDCDSENKPCDTRYGISCNSNGKCGCKFEGHQFYDHKREKCVTKIEGNCTSDDECVPFARCDQGTSNRRPPFHTTGRKRRNIIFGSGEKNAEVSFSNQNFNNRLPPNRFNVASQDGICVCQAGFSSTKDKFCMPSYGAPCHPKKSSDGSDGANRTEICNPDQFLECLSTGGHDPDWKSGFRCICRNPLNERWNRKLQQCVSRPGRRCRPSSAYPSCQEGTECQRGVCQCKNGTTLSSNGQCKTNFNEPCKPGDCNYSFGLICHSKTETCLCIDSYLKYDDKKKACVAEVGSPCGTGNLYSGENENFPAPPMMNNKKEPEPYIQCESNAICNPNFPGQQVNSKNVEFNTCVPRF